MNLSIERLFSDLESNRRSLQAEAVGRLAMLLERNAYPGRDESTWNLVLTSELLMLRLSPQDIKEILSRACNLLESKQLSNEIKVSLTGAIARAADADNADALFKFFSESVHTFSEQETFSCVASLSSLVIKVSDARRIQTVLQRRDVTRTLESLEARQSKRVQEAATRLLNYLKNHWQLGQT